MKLLFGFLFLLSNLSCAIGKNANDYERAVCLKIHWQLVGGENNRAELIDIIDSVFMIKKGDFFVYLIPHSTEYSQKAFSDGILVRDTVISETINFQAFIFQKNDSFGLKFDSLSATTANKFNVDSFLVNRTFKGMRSYNEDNDSLIERNSLEGNKVIEKFTPKVLYENSFDSTYFYFTREKIATGVSFSKVLEEKRGLKIYKLIGIYNEIPIGKYPFMVPKRTMSWEIQNLKLPFRGKIDILMDQYKKQES